MTADVDVQSYRPLLDPQAVIRLRRRLDDLRLPAGDGGWRQGVPADWLQELLGDWRSFDVDALQARLDAMTHVRVDIDGQVVHGDVDRPRCKILLVVVVARRGGAPPRRAPLSCAG